MKKSRFFIALFVGALLVGLAVPAYAIPEPTYSAWSNKSQNTGNKAAVRELKLVRYALSGGINASIASSEAVVYDTNSDDGVTVALTTTSGDATFAGIAVTSIATADGSGSTTFVDDTSKRNWGWIIVHGPAIAEVGVGGTNVNAVGAPFVTSTDSGSVTAVVGATVASGNGQAANVVARGKGGFFFDAVTAGTEAEVFVNVE